MNFAPPATMNLSIPSVSPPARTTCTTRAARPTPIPIKPIKPVNVADAEAVAKLFDKIWLENAPALAELRKVRATL